MILTGKKIYNVSVSTIRNYHKKLADIPKKNIHPVAQTKIAFSFISLRDVVALANEAIKALGEDPEQSAIDAIENAKQDVVIFEINSISEWNMKSERTGLVDLIDCKMVEAVEDPEPEEE